MHYITTSVASKEEEEGEEEESVEEGEIIGELVMKGDGTSRDVIEILVRIIAIAKTLVEMEALPETPQVVTIPFKAPQKAVTPIETP